MVERSEILRSIGFVSFFRSFGYGALWSFIVLFLTVHEKISLNIVGLYLFIVGIIGAFSQVIFGALSDSFGRKNILIMGQSGQGFSFILFGIGALMNSVIILFLSILIQSIFSNMVMVSFNAIIADIFDENERFGGYAFQRSLANFGWGIGPAIGGLIYQINIIPESFIIVGIFLFLINLIFISLPETNIKTAPFRFVDIIEPLKNRNFMIFSIASFLTFVIFGQFTSTYPVFENTVNKIDVFYIGLTWTLNGFLVGIFQYPVAKLVNVKNSYWFLIYGSLIYGLGYMMLPFNNTIIYLFVSMILITAGEIIYSSSVTATAVNFADEKEKGKYAGSFGFFTSIGRSMGPLYGGVVFSLSLNYVTKWFFIFLLVIISAILYLFLKYNYNKKNL